ncbi:Cna B-type domain-containing protein, partial [Anaerostipes hadrus]
RGGGGGGGGGGGEGGEEGGGGEGGGGAKGGYGEAYETSGATEDEGTRAKNVIITNTHSPDTAQKKGKKVWNDDSNRDGSRPKSVKVNLLADGKVEETLT